LTEGIPGAFRKTTQSLAPTNAPVPPESGYNLYPAFSIPGGKIHSGFKSLASLLAGQQRVVMDGYAG
jgi:hypothetical protein